MAKQYSWWICQIKIKPWKSTQLSWDGVQFFWGTNFDMIDYVNEMVGNLTTKLKPNDIIPDLETEDFSVGENEKLRKKNLNNSTHFLQQKFLPVREQVLTFTPQL